MDSVADIIKEFREEMKAQFREFGEELKTFREEVRGDHRDLMGKLDQEIKEREMGDSRLHKAREDAREKEIEARLKAIITESEERTRADSLEAEERARKDAVLAERLDKMEKLETERNARYRLVAGVASGILLPFMIALVPVMIEHHWDDTPSAPPVMPLR